MVFREGIVIVGEWLMFERGVLPSIQSERNEVQTLIECSTEDVLGGSYPSRERILCSSKKGIPTVSQWD